MGYNNSFKLSVSTEQTVTKFTCSCNKKIYDSGKFCSECGSKLEEVEVFVDVTDIIKKFRKSSEDASYLLDANGNTEENGSGHTIQEDLVKFSKNYPETLFQLYCEWDQGFGDPPTKVYVKNGKQQSCQAEYLFPEFDETKMV